MKSTCRILSVLLCVLMAGVVRADNKADQEAEMKAWMEAGTPGAPHQELAAMAGTWDTLVKSWHDPSSPPEESKGTTEFSMILGGRYLMQQFHGQMMGQPFEGIGYIAYDNIQKKYTTTWMDNMSTGIMVSQGTTDPKTGKTTYIGKMWEPSGKEITMEQVLTKVDPNHFIFEMFAPGPDGKNMKMMEMHYMKKA